MSILTYMIITADIDCGYSPRMKQMREVCIAFAQNNSDLATSLLSDNVIWELVGIKVLSGKEAVARQLSETPKDDQIKSLALKRVTCHGKVGAIDGMFETNGNQSFAFCNIYEFASHSKDAKISQISSYIIQSPTSLDAL